MAGTRYSELYIDTREDTKLLDKNIVSGSSEYTTVFSLVKDGLVGSLALYIDCEGSGTFDLSYEIDPCVEAGPTVLKFEHEWFTPEYRNPIKLSLSAGRHALPLKVLVGQFIKFKLTAIGGDLHINFIRLVIQ